METLDALPDSLSHALHCLPPFGRTPDDILAELAANARQMPLEKGAKIYSEGDLSETVFILTRGTIKVGRTSDDAREVIKQVLHPVTLFGELGLVGEARRKEFAQVISKEAIVHEIDLDCLHRIMRSHHSLAMGILRWLGGRLRHTENRLESLLFKDARQRIVEFIRDSARKRGRKVGYETLIRHSLTQQDIANITGTSRQTVTSVFNDLRKSNLIHFNRRSILIRDLAKLA